MGNFSYLLYKNRVKIILGAVIALIIGALLGYMIFSSSSLNKQDKQGKEDEIADSGGIGEDNTQIDTPITIAPEQDVEVSPVTEKQVVLRVSDNNDIYEVVLDKINNGTYLYKNEEVTDTRCFVEQQKLDAPLLELNSGIDGVPLSSLSKPRIEGAYEVNINTSSAVVNHLLKIGGTELRKVEAQDYIEIYLKEKSGTIKRIIVTNELLMVADYAKEELPSINSYWHEY